MFNVIRLQMYIFPLMQPNYSHIFMSFHKPNLIPTFASKKIFLNGDGSQIVRILRKEACFCRFAPAEKDGRIPYILYANWRKSISSKDDVEKIELLDFHSPWTDLQERMQANKGKKPKTSTRKFAIVSRVPTPDSTYYPIPLLGRYLQSRGYHRPQEADGEGSGGERKDYQLPHGYGKLRKGSFLYVLHQPEW